MPIRTHPKCLAVSEDGAVCYRSEGHTSSVIPERREHYDPDRDEMWTDDAETARKEG